MDLFDGAVFNLKRAESIYLDPQTRILLQLCLDAIKGYGEFSVRVESFSKVV